MLCEDGASGLALVLSPTQESLTSIQKMAMNSLQPVNILVRPATLIHLPYLACLGAIDSLLQRIYLEDSNVLQA